MGGVAPAAQLVSNSLVGDKPADIVAARQDEAVGVPAAPLPSALFAEKSSDAEDGSFPQLVPRLASVGSPGVTSAVEQVEAFVGSSTEAIPAADPANEPVAEATRSARTRESDAEMLVLLVSAFADGPDVVAVGADPSGTDGSGSDVDAVAGTVAVVPGPVAVVALLDGPSGELVFELETVIGSLEATVAGPALPPVADAEPPAADEPCGSGLTSGCADTPGLSASAEFPSTPTSAMTART